MVNRFNPDDIPQNKKNFLNISGGLYMEDSLLAVNGSSKAETERIKKSLRKVLL